MFSSAPFFIRGHKPHSTARRHMLAMIVLMLAFTSTASGQQPQSPNPAPPSPEYVTEKGFRSRVFEIKHRDPNSLVSVLRPLGSGFKGAMITASNTFKTLTVRDFPENIGAYEEALKRLDSPLSLQPDIELRIHVLMASNTEGAVNQPPAELKDVIKQLQSTLNYKSYSLVTTLLQRVREGGNYNSVQGRGVAQVTVLEGGTSRIADAGYDYNIGSISLTSSNIEAAKVQLNGFAFNISVGNLGQARVQTDVGVRDGERVVVGTSSLKDKGLILVLSARVIKQ